MAGLQGTLQCSGALCVLYSRKRSQVPIYVTAGLAEKANEYYKLLISWTNQKVHVIRTVITRTVTVITRTLMISWTHQKVRTTMEAA